MPESGVLRRFVVSKLALQASIPYAIRAFQCWLTFSKKGDQMQLINLGKYLSSFPVIWTSALKYNLEPSPDMSEEEQNEYKQYDEHLEVGPSQAASYHLAAAPARTRTQTAQHAREHTRSTHAVQHTSARACPATVAIADWSSPRH